MVLSPRQSLLCAALAGWKGDGACSWSSPATQDTILAWAASYVPTRDGLVEAFGALVAEGLFRAVEYPVFASPVYSCSYDVRFLAELPCDFTIDGEDVESLDALWAMLREEHQQEFGTAWLHWGICDGQGSQSGSSGLRPCLGPGCCWFTDRNDHCQWELSFAPVPREGWPDTSILTRRNDDGHREEAIAALLQAIKESWPRR